MFIAPVTQVGKVGAAAVAALLQEITHQRQQPSSAASDTDAASLPLLRRLGMRRWGVREGMDLLGMMCEEGGF